MKIYGKFFATEHVGQAMTNLSTELHGVATTVSYHTHDIHAPFSCQSRTILMPVTGHSHASTFHSLTSLMTVPWHPPDSHANSYWLSRSPRSNPETVRSLVRECARLSGEWIETGMRMHVTVRGLARNWHENACDWHENGLELAGVW